MLEFAGICVRISSHVFSSWSIFASSRVKYSLLKRLIFIPESFQMVL